MATEPSSTFVAIGPESGTFVERGRASGTFVMMAERTFRDYRPTDSFVMIGRAHLREARPSAFLAAADSDDPTWRLPGFVERELRAIVEVAQVIEALARGAA